MNEDRSRPPGAGIWAGERKGRRAEPPPVRTQAERARLAAGAQVCRCRGGLGEYPKGWEHLPLWPLYSSLGAETTMSATIFYHNEPTSLLNPESGYPEIWLKGESFSSSKQRERNQVNDAFGLGSPWE